MPTEIQPSSVPISMRKALHFALKVPNLPPHSEANSNGFTHTIRDEQTGDVYQCIMSCLTCAGSAKLCFHVPTKATIARIVPRTPNEHPNIALQPTPVTTPDGQQLECKQKENSKQRLHQGLDISPAKYSPRLAFGSDVNQQDCAEDGKSESSIQSHLEQQLWRDGKRQNVYIRDRERSEPSMKCEQKNGLRHGMFTALPDNAVHGKIVENSGCSDLAGDAQVPECWETACESDVQHLASQNICHNLEQAQPEPHQSVVTAIQIVEPVQNTTDEFETTVPSPTPEGGIEVCMGKWATAEANRRMTWSMWQKLMCNVDDASIKRVVGLADAIGSVEVLQRLKRVLQDWRKSFYPRPLTRGLKVTQSFAVQSSSQPSSADREQAIRTNYCICKMDVDPTMPHTDMARRIALANLYDSMNAMKAARLRRAPYGKRPLGKTANATEDLFLVIHGVRHEVFNKGDKGQPGKLLRELQHMLARGSRSRLQSDVFIWDSFAFMRGCVRGKLATSFFSSSLPPSMTMPHLMSSSMSSSESKTFAFNWEGSVMVRERGYRRGPTRRRSRGGDSKLCLAEANRRAWRLIATRNLLVGCLETCSLFHASVLSTCRSGNHVISLQSHALNTSSLPLQIPEAANLKPQKKDRRGLTGDRV